MMGALLGFFGSAALAPAALLRLKALLIGAAVLAAICLALVTWALLERSGRLSLKVEVVALEAQKDVLAEAIGRQNEGVERTAKAGADAVAETRRLLGMVETGLLRTAAMRDEARSIISKPPPLRADGKPKDCADALGELKAKVKP